jgi:hypothetical protein
VPRFRCSTCGRGFSRQTFRADYRDHRPDQNVEVLRQLVSGTGLRQTGRLTGLSVAGVQRKFRKLGRVLMGLNRNLLHRLPANRCFLFDELETFEDRSILPVTVPVLIEKESKLVVATAAAPIRRVRRRNSPKRRELERYELEHGKRQDRGRDCVAATLRRFGTLLGEGRAVLLTDQKGLYAALCKRLFGARVLHCTYSSRLPRDTRNPLFPINHTEAMLRDNCGRLRRRSWLVSKQAKYLRLQLELFTAYRNWHRTRTNDDVDGRTPGVVLGLLQRRLEWEEMLAWRQDWHRRSIHPASNDARQCVASTAA